MSNLSSKVPLLPLNNGHYIPAIGLGTWKSSTEEVSEAVQNAIQYGYRHFDCAHIYKNEPELGKAISASLKENNIKRSDIFITSKLWNTFHDPELVRTACEQSLKDLRLTYLDLYLIHWPMGFKENPDPLTKQSDDISFISDIDYVETWKEMEKLVDCGLVKSIGVSNFNIKQIQRILDSSSITPAINQVECHPYLTQKELVKFCKEHKILITAYSPLGAPNREGAKSGDPILLHDPIIKDLAKKHKKTTAQILIRYQIQNGNVVVPKSVNKDRILSNIQVFDFKLSNDDMTILDNLHRNLRFIPFCTAKDHPFYPF